LGVAFWEQGGLSGDRAPERKCALEGNAEEVVYGNALAVSVKARVRFKVELRPEVSYFVRRQCNGEERREFYEQIERLQVDPIEISEAFADPDLSQYVLRYFRFRHYVAVFDLDAYKSRIIVRTCRRRSERQSNRIEKPDGRQ